MNPPQQDAGIVYQGNWFFFDNSRQNLSRCLIWHGGCYKNSGIQVKWIRKNLIDIKGKYACSGMPFEWGKCTGTGWKRSSDQPNF